MAFEVSSALAEYILLSVNLNLAFVKSGFVEISKLPVKYCASSDTASFKVPLDINIPAFGVAGGDTVISTLSLAPPPNGEFPLALITYVPALVNV